MVMSPRKPGLGPDGFLPWFSTRKLVKSGHTTPLERRTSELSGVPALIAVIRSTVVESPRFAQSGTHPIAVKAPIASDMMKAFALIAFLPGRIGICVSTADIGCPPLALDDPRGDEEEQLVV